MRRDTPAARDWDCIACSCPSPIPYQPQPHWHWHRYRGACCVELAPIVKWTFAPPPACVFQACLAGFGCRDTLGCVHAYVHVIATLQLLWLLSNRQTLASSDITSAWTPPSLTSSPWHNWPGGLLANASLPCKSSSHCFCTSSSGCYRRSGSWVAFCCFLSYISPGGYSMSSRSHCR